MTPCIICVKQMHDNFEKNRYMDFTNMNFKKRLAHFTSYGSCSRASPTGTKVVKERIQ